MEWAAHRLAGVCRLGRGWQSQEGRPSSVEPSCTQSCIRAQKCSAQRPESCNYRGALLSSAGRTSRPERSSKGLARGRGHFMMHKILMKERKGGKDKREMEGIVCKAWGYVKNCNMLSFHCSLSINLKLYLVVDTQTNEVVWQVMYRRTRDSTFTYPEPIGQLQHWDKTVIGYHKIGGKIQK